MPAHPPVLTPTLTPIVECLLLDDIISLILIAAFSLNFNNLFAHKFNSNLAASDILSFVQGGSQTNLRSTFL